MIFAWNETRTHSQTLCVSGPAKHFPATTTFVPANQLAGGVVVAVMAVVKAFHLMEYYERFSVCHGIRYKIAFAIRSLHLDLYEFYLGRSRTIYLLPSSNPRYSLTTPSLQFFFESSHITDFWSAQCVDTLARASKFLKRSFAHKNGNKTNMMWERCVRAIFVCMCCNNICCNVLGIHRQNREFLTWALTLTHKHTHIQCGKSKWKKQTENFDARKRYA